MDDKAEIRDFLRTRRARIHPDDVGFPALAGRRRVRGLRREEVALLAGVSVDYWVRLERGHLRGVSDRVLQAIAAALRLDEHEQAYLHDLARRTDAWTGPVPTPSAHPRSRVQHVLDGIRVPAWARSGRGDFVAGNRLGRALYEPLTSSGPGRGNMARFLFLDRASRVFYPDWDDVASQLTATLRAEAARRPGDEAMRALLDELRETSSDFRAYWAAHEVLRYRHGEKLIRHPRVGELVVDYDAMTLTAEPGLTIILHDAEPGSTSAARLALLAELQEHPAAFGRVA